MAIEAKAKIQVQGGSEALKTIQGIQRATRAASAEATKAARESERASARAAKEQQRVSREAQRQALNATREEQKKAREIERAAKRQADAQIREAHRADRELARIQRSEERRWRQLAENSARVREQAEQRTARAREKSTRDSARGGMPFASGAVTGVLAGGAVASSTARGVAGVADVGERIRSANAFQGLLLRTGTQAGVSGKALSDIQSNVLATSEKTGIDPLELAGALEQAQKQFNGFEKFAGVLETLAKTAQASGADVKDLTVALGSVAQANNITSAKDMKEALDLMVAAASKGSVEMADFARDFADAAGIFATNTGASGIEGVRQFAGVSQGVATGLFGSAESSTRVKRLSADLQDKEVLSGLRGIGVKVDPKNIDVFALIDQLATNKKFKNASTRQRIFKEQNSLQAVEALVNARNRVANKTDANAVDARTVGEVSSLEGGKITNDTFSKLEAAGAIELQRQAIRAQNEVIQNLKSYNDQILAVNRVTNDLEKRLGTLALWLPAAGAVGAGSLIGGALSGGGGGGGGGGVTIGGFSPAAVASLAAAFTAGYSAAQALGADKWWEDADKFYRGDRSTTSRKVGERPSTDAIDLIGNLLGGGGSLMDGVKVKNLDRNKPVTATPDKAAAPVVQEVGKVVKELKTLNEQMSRRPAPPINQEPRGRM